MECIIFYRVFVHFHQSLFKNQWYRQASRKSELGKEVLMSLK